jgi:DNA-cytosine methyltransferase|tara:strand:+ start:494 stop:1450 length:957 start_codon:yes stop_codon:yes gene_type:complete
MRILSLFDGISCGRIALQRAGISNEKYYASEIEKSAIKISKSNWFDIEHLGDINYWWTWDIDWSSIDLILAGSPCQGFSFAGKQLAFNDPRSKLFFTFVEILNHIRSLNPNIKFLLENVKMKKEYLTVISNTLGVEPVFINSSLVSAQNRQRYYWCNWDITQPNDKKILLSDIIEQGVVDRDKSFCIDANYWKGGNVEQYIRKNRRQIAFTERRTEEAKRIRREYKQLYGKDFCPRRAKELVAREDGKMNCLTATFSTKEHTLIDEKLYYRKLTPVECERLQTIPDNYTSSVSNTQRYKALGNGWTVDVIAHILRQMK